MRLGYIDRERNTSERVVDPLGLVSKGSIWYLLAGTERGLRTFRVGRVRSAEILDEAAVRPADFDLSAAWRTVVETVGERRMRVRATILMDPSLLPGLRGQFGSDMLLAEVGRPGNAPARPDGRVEVIIGGPTAVVIAQHLAGWGRLIEVVEPIAVQAHLARLARELCELYADVADVEVGSAPDALRPGATGQVGSG